MTRLIDADELKIDYGFTWDDIAPTHEEMYAIIDRQPTIDAVQVIRCKDCKYNLNNARLFDDPDPILTYAWCNTEAFQENDFCSKGKRREE